MPIDTNGACSSMLLGAKSEPELDWLTFTAVQPNSSVQLNKSKDDPSLNAKLEVRVNDGRWTEYKWTGVTGTEIELPSIGDRCQWRAVNSNARLSIDFYSYYQFKMLKAIEVTGDARTLLSKNELVKVIPDFSFESLCRTAIVGNPIVQADEFKASSCRNMFRQSLISSVHIIGNKVNTNTFYQICYSCTVQKALIEISEISPLSFQYAFYNCSKLNDITVKFKDWSSDGTRDWVRGVSPTGDFYCPADLPLIWDDSHIPIGWTAHPEGKEPVPYPEPLEDKYLRFTAEQDGSLLRLDKSADVPELNARLEYKINSGNWEEYTWGTDKDTPVTQGHLISLPKVGDCVKWRAVGKNETFSNLYGWYKFLGSGSIKADGDLLSLLDKNITVKSLATIPYCYYNLFNGQNYLTETPYCSSTELSKSCFFQLYFNCRNLVVARHGISADVNETSCMNMYLSCNKLSQFAGISSSSVEKEGLSRALEGTNISEIDLTSIAKIKFRGLTKAFVNCKNLQSIKVSLRSWIADDGSLWSDDWVQNVSPHGTFTCPSDLPVIFGDSNIPHGWTVDNGLTEVSEEEVLNACYQYNNGRLIIQPDFKNCLNRAEQIDFVKHGKTYWKAGTPLPNPHRTDIDAYYKVTSLQYTFQLITEARGYDLKIWDLSQVTRCDDMCYGNYQLLDYTYPSTSKLTNIEGAFQNCSRLVKIDFSKVVFSTLVKSDKAFRLCNAVTTAYARTQADCDKLNASPDKPTTWEFVIHPDLLNVPYFTVDGNLHFAKADDVNGYPQYVCRQDASTITFAPSEQADGSVRYVITQTSNGGHTATYVCDTPLDKPIDTTACTGKRQLLRDATYADASGAKHEFTFTFEAPPKPEPEPNVTEFWVADAVNDELNGHYTPEGDTYVNAKTGTAFWANPNPTIPSYMFVPSGGGVEYTVYPYIPEMKHPEYEGRQYCKELLAQCREYETPDMEKHPFSILFEKPVPQTPADSFTLRLLPESDPGMADYGLGGLYVWSAQDGKYANEAGVILGVMDEGSSSYGVIVASSGKLGQTNRIEGLTAASQRNMDKLAGIAEITVGGSVARVSVSF